MPVALSHNFFISYLSQHIPPDPIGIGREVEALLNCTYVQMNSDFGVHM